MHIVSTQTYVTKLVCEFLQLKILPQQQVTKFNYPFHFNPFVHISRVPWRSSPPCRAWQCVAKNRRTTTRQREAIWQWIRTSKIQAPKYFSLADDMKHSVTTNSKANIGDRTTDNLAHRFCPRERCVPVTLRYWFCKTEIVGNHCSDAVV
jgi:hypothetical protein